MSKLFLLLALWLTLFTLKFAKAQIDLSQPAPIDPEIRTGVLQNGLTYFIRHNGEPKERASFYMIQNVGALLEEDEQNGLAHFLEHMAFNGTEHFEGKGILNTLEKHGVAFGRNINAYTSFNETVYNLSDVPTTHPGLIDTCLLILHDWSDYLLLTEDEIDLERGVIAEEWRTRRNSAFRLQNQYFPVLFKGSKWAERDIIGDTTVIKYHRPETLRQFYHDWYRTDLQSIAVVGDIDVDETERKIKELFSTIPAVENPKERPVFQIPSHNERYFVLATDKEASHNQIRLYTLHENNDGKVQSLNDIREGYIQMLFNSMTGMRIQELLQKGTPPFVAGALQYSGMVRGYDVYQVVAISNPNEEHKALEAIMAENERIKRFGFTESELERTKLILLTNLESAYKQKDKIQNDSYCNNIRDYFLTGSPMTGMDFTWAFAQAVAPTIGVDEINQKARMWMKDSDQVLIITGPSEGVTHLAESEAHAIIEEIKTRELEPWIDQAASASLISEELPGSPVVNEKRIDELDAVEWTLANNVKVVYRHAAYEKDNVTLRAFSNGGTSLWDDAFVPSAQMVSDFVSSYGVGDFDAISLQKMLAGKKVSLSLSLDDLSEGFMGSSTPKDFETLMQLAWLFFEKPRFDRDAHDALMARYQALVENLEKDPRKIMQDSLMFITNNYHPRARSIGKQYLGEVRFDDIQKIYTDRFADAGDFTFFIVGNIDEPTVRQMAETYLGSLRDSERSETWVDRKIRRPEGLTERTIPIELTTPKANVNILYETDLAYGQKNKLALEVLDGILDLRYTETVREDEGGSYSVNVGTGFRKDPIEKASLRISFDCDPDRVDELKKIIYREIEKIVAEGPTPVDFEKTVLNKLKDRQQAREHNSFWMGALFSLYRYGINTASEENYETLLKEMTPGDVQQLAQSFFSRPDKMDIVFVPKQSE
ncbi:MAG TPA: insulinase family protein [Prolixibacteraceae bacterium]|nr:insulinase family protein [Prolixibacteraceae bacterium]